MDYCERCENIGILGISNNGLPIVCNCEIGKNTKEANPDWLEENCY